MLINNCLNQERRQKFLVTHHKDGSFRFEMESSYQSSWFERLQTTLQKGAGELQLYRPSQACPRGHAEPSNSPLSLAEILDQWREKPSIIYKLNNACWSEGVACNMGP